MNEASCTVHSPGNSSHCGSSHRSHTYAAREAASTNIQKPPLPGVQYVPCIARVVCGVRVTVVVHGRAGSRDEGYYTQETQKQQHKRVSACYDRQTDRRIISHR
jgi:hypothetical protein